MSGFEPIALAISAASAVAGTVVSMGAASAQAANARQQAEYQRQVAERDQAIVDQNRRYAFEQARIDAEDASRDQRRQLSAIRTAYGAAGVDLAGSPLDVLTDTAYETALDVQRTEDRGRVQAREFEMQKLGIQDNAYMAELQYQNARTQARYSSAASMLSGIGSLASSGARVYKSGVDNKWWG